MRRAATAMGLALAAAMSGAVMGSRPAASGAEFRSMCAPTTGGFAVCQAEFRVDASGGVSASSTPAGHTPKDLQSAYRLPSATAGTGETVAVVDAYDNPNAESDLEIYRSTFGLRTCTAANGCFRKVDQNGGAAYPQADTGWAGEISLDLDMVSAACPNCNILLVEASSPSLKNLAVGVRTAASLGAVAISNSYARYEASGETQYDSEYRGISGAGTMITAASGNGGYTMGATYPAASPYVVAVGGTRLTRASNARGWSEAVWSKTSSGCSSYEAKPAWQRDAGCSRRTVADTAAVAVYLAVYDTYNQSGWSVAYGTSAPTPIIAAAYALEVSQTGLMVPADASSLYRSGASLFDITSGSTGSCGDYLCEGVAGYDGPSGNGSPRGVTAY